MPHAISYKWVKASGADVPPNAVEIGFDLGNIVYVARAKHEGQLIPGKMLPIYGMCYIPYDGKEIECVEYEILTDPTGSSFEWIEASSPDIVPGAFQAGVDNNGDPLYVGRAMHSGAMCGGKIHPNDGLLYIPYGGGEHIYENFEFLVVKGVDS